MYIKPLIASCIHATERVSADALTQRESHVMQKVVYGLNDRRMGEYLYLSVDTIKYHLKQVCQKLAIRKRTPQLDSHRSPT